MSREQEIEQIYSNLEQEIKSLKGLNNQRAIQHYVNQSSLQRKSIEPVLSKAKSSTNISQPSKISTTKAERYARDPKKQPAQNDCKELNLKMKLDLIKKSK